MLTAVPNSINSLSRNVVLNHPNSFQCVMMRKVVDRTSATSVGGSPTLGGMAVISSDDEENVSWDVLGNGYSLQVETYTAGLMMDRQDANNGGIDEYRFLIEPETEVGNGTGAVLTPVVLAGVVTDVTIDAGGNGYLTGQQIVFTGAGTGALATITAVNGVITAVTVDNGGTGYSAVPTVTISNYGFDIKKNDVMYLVLGSVRMAYEIIGIETTSNISPYTQRFICNRRDDLHVIV